MSKQQNLPSEVAATAKVASEDSEYTEADVVSTAVEQCHDSPGDHHSQTAVHTLSDADLEAANKEASHDLLDIEHAAVQDDPRLWSSRRKALNLAIVSFAAIAPAVGVSIYNPAFGQIESQLHASTSEIALSLSLFIIVQGGAPIIWSGISEIKGRTVVYFSSLIIFVIGCTIAALARSMGLLIGMRIIQAVGAAAALTTGSGTIADMYEPHERGAKVGIYYAFPLLGPALGPILGGILVQIWSWRSTFWFMVIEGGISIIFCFFMKDSFRKERSLAYIAAKERASSRTHSRSHSTHLSRVPSHTLELSAAHTETDILDHGEKVVIGPVPALSHEQMDETVKISISDVNPLAPAWQVMKQRSNVAILLASGLLFGLSYGICYTCARTFAAEPYSYDPLIVGAILLSFGAGSVSGSILGGRFSDRILARLKRLNGGVSQPEMRLKSTTIAMFALPLVVLAYGWTTHYHVHVAAPVIILFMTGFMVIWTYSSTLTYIVDSNPGRASTAIAMNSCFRGLAGFIVAEVSAPIQDAIGDGGLYSIWTGVLFGVAGLIMYTSRRGAVWRATEETKRLQRKLEEAKGARGGS